MAPVRRTVGVGSGEGSVEGVEATVEAGACVEQDQQCRVGSSGAEGEVDGGQGLADGDRNGRRAGGRDGREGMDVEDKLTVALGAWCGRRVGVAVVEWGGCSDSEGGTRWRRWWGVNDLLVGPSLHGFPSGGRGKGLGEEGIGGGLAEGAHGREVVVDVLGGIGKAAEFMELQGEGELLGQRGRPGGNGGGAGGVQGRSVGEEGLEDVGRGVVGGLARLGVESGGLELAKVMEDCLGGGFIADGGPNLVLFDEGREAGEVTVTEEGFQAVGQGALGRG
eukprot:scaffold10118_cov148-Amphora_coffeaeformis.AAC.3